MLIVQGIVAVLDRVAGLLQAVESDTIAALGIHLLLIQTLLTLQR